MSQKAFQTGVKQLVEVMAEMGNPFCDDFEELVTLDTCDCPDEAVMTVHNIDDIEHCQHSKYLKFYRMEHENYTSDSRPANSLATSIKFS